MNQTIELKDWDKTYIICATIGTSSKNKYPFAYSNEDISKLKK